MKLAGLMCLNDVGAPTRNPLSRPTDKREDDPSYLPASESGIEPYPGSSSTAKATHTPLDSPSPSQNPPPPKSSPSTPLIFRVPWRALSGLMRGLVLTDCKADLKLLDAVAARIVDEVVRGTDLDLDQLDLDPKTSPSSRSRASSAPWPDLVYCIWALSELGHTPPGLRLKLAALGAPPAHEGRPSNEEEDGIFQEGPQSPPHPHLPGKGLQVQRWMSRWAVRGTSDSDLDPPDQGPGPEVQPARRRAEQLREAAEVAGLAVSSVWKEAHTPSLVQLPSSSPVGALTEDHCPPPVEGCFKRWLELSDEHPWRPPAEGDIVRRRGGVTAAVAAAAEEGGSSAPPGTGGGGIDAKSGAGSIGRRRPFRGIAALLKSDSLGIQSDLDRWLRVVDQDLADLASLLKAGTQQQQREGERERERERMERMEREEREHEISVGTTGPGALALTRGKRASRGAPGVMTGGRHPVGRDPGSWSIWAAAIQRRQREVAEGAAVAILCLDKILREVARGTILEEGNACGGWGAEATSEALAYLGYSRNGVHRSLDQLCSAIAKAGAVHLLDPTIPGLRPLCGEGLTYQGPDPEGISPRAGPDPDLDPAQICRTGALLVDTICSVASICGALTESDALFDDVRVNGSGARSNSMGRLPWSCGVRETVKGTVRDRRGVWMTHEAPGIRAMVGAGIAAATVSIPLRMAGTLSAAASSGMQSRERGSEGQGEDARTEDQGNVARAGRPDDVALGSDLMGRLHPADLSRLAWAVSVLRRDGGGDRFWSRLADTAETSAPLMSVDPDHRVLVRAAVRAAERSRPKARGTVGRASRGESRDGLTTAAAERQAEASRLSPPWGRIAGAVCGGLVAEGASARVSEAGPAAVSELVGGLTMLMLRGGSDAQSEVGHFPADSDSDSDPGLDQQSPDPDIGTLAKAAYRSLAEGLLMSPRQRRSKSQPTSTPGSAHHQEADVDPGLDLGDVPLIYRMRPKELARTLKGFAEAGFHDLGLFDAAVRHATDLNPTSASSSSTAAATLTPLDRIDPGTASRSPRDDMALSSLSPSAPADGHEQRFSLGELLTFLWTLIR